jgi:hypothetical protein
MLATPAYATGTVGSVILVDWRRQPTKSAVQTVEKVIATLLSERPGKIGLLVVVRLDNPAPDAEARDAFAQSMKAHSDRVYGSTMTIEGGGLRAAANRAVLTAITLLGDISPIPKVCSSIEEAANLLTRMSAEANGAGSLVAADVVTAFSDLKTHENARAPV